MFVNLEIVKFVVGEMNIISLFGMWYYLIYYIWKMYIGIDIVIIYG